MHAPTATPEAESQTPTSTAYVLVVLKPGENRDDYRHHASGHIEFVDNLIKRNRILLGGAFATGAGYADAAYVLRASSIAAAQAIAAADPFVINGVCQLECFEWELIGINPDAVDETLIVRPDDIG
jgi:uncharacterized protein YciI